MSRATPSNKLDTSVHSTATMKPRIHDALEDGAQLLWERDPLQAWHAYVLLPWLKEHQCQAVVYGSQAWTAYWSHVVQPKDTDVCIYAPYRAWSGCEPHPTDLLPTVEAVTQLQTLTHQCGQYLNVRCVFRKSGTRKLQMMKLEAREGGGGGGGGGAGHHRHHHADKTETGQLPQHHHTLDVSFWRWEWNRENPWSWTTPHAPPAPSASHMCTRFTSLPIVDQGDLLHMVHGMCMGYVRAMCTGQSIKAATHDVMWELLRRLYLSARTEAWPSPMMHASNTWMNMSMECERMLGVSLWHILEAHARYGRPAICAALRRPETLMAWMHQHVPDVVHIIRPSDTREGATFHPVQSKSSQEAAGSSGGSPMLLEAAVDTVDVEREVLPSGPLAKAAPVMVDASTQVSMDTRSAKQMLKQTKHTLHIQAEETEARVWSACRALEERLKRAESRQGLAVETHKAWVRTQKRHRAKREAWRKTTETWGEGSHPLEQVHQQLNRLIRKTQAAKEGCVSARTCIKASLDDVGQRSTIMSALCIDEAGWNETSKTVWLPRAIELADQGVVPFVWAAPTLRLLTGLETPPWALLWSVMWSTVCSGRHMWGESISWSDASPPSVTSYSASRTETGEALQELTRGTHATIPEHVSGIVVARTHGAVDAEPYMGHRGGGLWEWLQTWWRGVPEDVDRARWHVPTGAKEVDTKSNVVCIQQAVFAMSIRAMEEDMTKLKWQSPADAVLGDMLRVWCLGGIQDVHASMHERLVKNDATLKRARTTVHTTEQHVAFIHKELQQIQQAIQTWAQTRDDV